MKQKNEKDLLIIIPAYNEEDSINELFDKIEQSRIKDIADVLIINDGSIDKTNEILRENKYPHITHVCNLGYGGALQTGYKYAIRRDYSYVIQLDADGQHDLCNIMPIYERLKQKGENGRCPDIVLGSRFVEGAISFPISFEKKIAIGFFRMLIRLFSHKKITDPTTGLQGLSRQAVLYYSKFSNFDDHFPDANMIIQMLLLGFEVQEMPAVMHSRETGTSMHSGLKPLIYMIRMFFSIIAIWIRICVMKKVE